jgi:hypothetical protein
VKVLVWKIVGWMSEAIAETNIVALPDKDIAVPPPLLSDGLRVRVVPDAVYVPAPISQSVVPSSIT